MFAATLTEIQWLFHFGLCPINLIVFINDFVDGKVTDRWIHWFSNSERKIKTSLLRIASFRGRCVNVGIEWGLCVEISQERLLTDIWINSIG